MMTGCAQLPFEKPQPPAKTKTQILPATKLRTEMRHSSGSFWDDYAAEGEGSSRIVISLSEQRAYFYKGKRKVGESTISSGKQGYSTPPGHYTVIQKDKNHRSNLYGEYVDAEGDVVKHNVDVTKSSPPKGAHFLGAGMPYFMRFRGGYGMHAGYLPGYAASHGCVRMPRSMAAHFFHAAHEGTPVTVKQ